MNAWSSQLKVVILNKCRFLALQRWTRTVSTGPYFSSFLWLQSTPCTEHLKMLAVYFQCRQPNKQETTIKKKVKMSQGVEYRVPWCDLWSFCCYTCCVFVILPTPAHDCPIRVPLHPGAPADFGIYSSGLSGGVPQGWSIFCSKNKKTQQHHFGWLTFYVSISKTDTW